MDNQKQQIVEKLKAANNILVTVSNNPSVDQLAACIGLTLVLNKLDKHATAVFSGQIPDTIDFLKPEETIEKNTDSLRDFIIALDKSKADKLRYKVEDKVVKIFITPYRTSLSADDLNFSQGDFNVDVVLALGVKQQTELDQAITSHGRILHDAVVMCINNTQAGELGSVNWLNTDASSLSELVTELAKSFEKPMLDAQISTALLTGIVAETDRFRNAKTTAVTMSLSADLMTAGANQQLVAKELEHEIKVQGDNQDNTPAGAMLDKASDTKPPKPDDGMLEIDHEDKKEPPPPPPAPPMELPKPEEPVPEVHDEKPTGQSAEEYNETKKPEPADADTIDNNYSHQTPGRALIVEPPTLGGTLTANAQPDNGDNLAMTMPKEEPKAPLLDRDSHQTPPDLDQAAPAPEPPSFQESELPKPSAPSTPPPPLVSTPEPPLPAAPPPPPPPMPPQPLTQPAATYDPEQFTPPAPKFDAPAPPPSPPSHDEPPKHETLSELEQSVRSPHTDSAEEVQQAREAVMKALSEQSEATPLPPVEALNAQPIELGKPPEMNQPMNQVGSLVSPPGSTSAPLPPLPPNAPDQPPFSNSPADQPMTMPMPPGINLPPVQSTPPTNASGGPTPPPVPPPMVPPPYGQNK